MIPDVIALEVEEGKRKLKEQGYEVATVTISQPLTKKIAGNSLRIVRQQTRLDGRVDLIVVYEISGRM